MICDEMKDPKMVFFVYEAGSWPNNMLIFISDIMLIFISKSPKIHFNKLICCVYGTGGRLDRRNRRSKRTAREE